MRVIRVYTDLDKEIAIILCEIYGMDPHAKHFHGTEDEYETWQEGCFLGRAMKIVQRVRDYDKLMRRTTMELGE